VKQTSESHESLVKAISLDNNPSATKPTKYL